MINAASISTTDPSLAQRVYWAALGIAPCLPTLTEEAEEAALEILKGVFAFAKRRGDTVIASQGVGSARVSYRDKDWFSATDRAALRAICAQASGAPSGVASLPAGSFPPPDPKLNSLWPEPWSKP